MPPKSLLTFSLLLTTIFSTFAQPGIKDSIYSKSIGEQRKLIIQLPKEYHPGSTDKYRVIYLLDGEWNAELFEQVQSWSRQWGFTMPVIMVGVANSYPNNQNQRFRDLTPTSAGNPNAGGGPNLLSFLKDELIPYIDKTYPSNGHNILWGHSLGGLFVIYSLFTEPGLFDAYIAADPSCWWDHGFLKAYAKERMKNIRGIKSLFITGRTGAAYHDMGIDSLLIVLKQNAPSNLLWKDVAYPDETHISQQYKSAYDGLKYTLAPDLIDRIHLDPMGGIIAQGMPFSFHCTNLLSEKNIRYTIDGSEPTLGSRVMMQDNTLTPAGEIRLNIKAFNAVDSLNKSYSAIFKSGSPWPAKKKPEHLSAGAWNYTAYKTAPASGSGPDAIAGSEVPFKSGNTAEHIDLNQFDSNGFFCRINGYLETTKKGYYTFVVEGEPGTKCYINDQLVMEIPAGGDYYSFLLPLDKGFYPIRFEYTHRKGGNRFDCGYQIPDEPGGQDFPQERQYH